jgi:hypothetical protein
MAGNVPVLTIKQAANHGSFLRAIRGSEPMNAVVQAPVDLMEAVAALRLPARANGRLQELMDRNNEGSLGAEEKAELETWVELSESLSLVRARALHLLGRKPA